MKLLVDRDISHADQAFNSFGEVQLFDGRALKNADLGDAEVLLTRSVTRVGRELLAGSAIRYVGTTTAGTDHVDQSWLAEHNITFTAAPGCNAHAVAEHVICCIAAYAAERGLPPSALSVGVIGYGHVGRALAQLLGRLGIEFVVNDPPLGSNIPGVDTASLDDVLERDVVTVHVPLVQGGAHPTRHLINAEGVARLPNQALLINAARGGVVDEQALLKRAETGALLSAAIDCWDGEPSPSAAMLTDAWRATTHIAGHTLEARINAVNMQQQQLAAWTGMATPSAVKPVKNPGAVIAAKASDLASILETVHPLTLHTSRLAALADLAPAARAPVFDRLRRDHGLRREFSSYSVARAALDPDTVAQLEALGFTLT